MTRIAALLVAGAATAVNGQTTRAEVRCDGQVISDVVIRSHAPSYGGLFARSAVLGRFITSMHVVSEPSLIEHFVLLKRGDRCSLALRLETERILRAQPYLADASVRAYADSADAVTLEVVTVDEPSLLGSIGVKSESPFVRALTLGNANFRGKGIYFSAGWRNGFQFRDTFLGNYRNYQLFGRPYQLHVAARRREFGYEVATTMGYPFYTDLQRFTWRTSVGARDDLTTFRAPDLPHLSLPLQRQYVDAGGLVRVGETGKLALAGVSVSHERARSGAAAVVVTDSGLQVDTTHSLDDRYGSFRSSRLNLLVGLRRLDFLRVEGFDALTGAQDVRRGVQLAGTVGRGMRLGGAPSAETYLEIDAYAGAGSRVAFGAVQIIAEGRHRRGHDILDDLLMGGRLAAYFKPHRRHTMIGSLEYGAGKRQRLPFQLTLGDRRGGVRGYEKADLGGGERFVARFEERWRVGNIRGTADAGVALWMDVGRLRAGDSPLGRDTEYKPAVGLGLLAAVPPRSRRMWRVDLAIPLRPEAGAKWSVRISNEDRTRAFWIEPNDLRRNHSRAAPAIGW